MVANDSDVERYCERVDILMIDGGYRLEYMARQAAFDMINRWG